MNAVFAHLWLGDANDAITFAGHLLCVLESGPGYSLRPGDTHVPILMVNGKASRKQLDLAAACISDHVEHGRELLVHCGAGVER